jgi:hypothetical protein
MRNKDNTKEILIIGMRERCKTKDIIKRFRDYMMNFPEPKNKCRMIMMLLGFHCKMNFPEPKNKCRMIMMLLGFHCKMRMSDSDRRKIRDMLISKISMRV